MTLSPAWRTRTFTAGAAVVGVWLSVEIASGNFLWPTTIAGALALFFIARIQPLPLGTLALTAVSVGYILGNRGFAQVSLSTRLPLLPGELALLFAGGLLLVQCAWRHELPLKRDPLNFAIFAWILIGALRIGFDFRVFGIMALRDFALVYYAAFFYLGQELARDPRSLRFFTTLLAVSCAFVLPVFLLFERYPDFFFNVLSFRGNPLIYFKGDLAGTFVAIGAVLFFLRFESGGSRWNVAVSLLLAGAVVALNNRASMLALFVAAAWLAVRGRWRFAASLSVASVVAIVGILSVASALRISWEKTPVFSIYERIVSIADPMGQRMYRGSETFNKGDNNLYRSVWWTAVIDETIAGNPYVGLGFGHDLAARFVREYYPESSDEFNVRSPHNVLISIFARMGAIGLAAFLLIMAAIAVQTWRTIPRSPAHAGPWCVVWAMLTSACLGVVLEGPMGAVVFWTVLGVAQGQARSDTTELLAETVPPSATTSAPPAPAPTLAS
jgi:O-antigen ligase